MRTLNSFNHILNTMGSDVIVHQETGGTPCPCLTPEGFRDPSWHRDHPDEPVCNEEGILPGAILNVVVKAAVQPATGGQRTRAAERSNALLGEVQKDDHLGIFPVRWGGVVLDFSTFSDSGDDYIVYDNRRFLVVASDKIPDVDGDPNHHFELGLRLVKSERPT